MIDTDLNIIMPWADMDLEDYLLGGYQSMKFDASLLASLLKESGELAGALKFLHGGLQAKCEWPKLPQQALCHADFRPRNILVFKKDDSSTGTWGITDFGVSQQYNSSLSRDIYESGLFSTRNSVPPPRGGMYQAPDPHASQKSDIWSFGCILTQIFGLGLAHAHHFLPRALEERPLERKLTWKPFNVRFCGEGLPALNPEVEKWIEELPDLYCGSFHNLFLTEMKSLLSSMLQINSESRPSATKVRRHLHSLYRMATGDGLPFTDPGSTTPLPISTPTRSSISSDPDLRTPGPPIDRLSIGLLVVIIESGDVKSVKECLKSKPDVEEHHENDRPLIHAIKIKGESAPIVSALLQYKSDLDVETPSFAKETPLHLAISKGDVDLVRLLIGALVRNNSESGLNELSTKGKTPLMEAAYRGHVAVVSALLDAGADTKICTGDDKHNCLHYAVDNIASEEDLIRAFLGRNMDFNLSPSGITGYETPIMRHIWNGVHGKYGIPKANARWKRKFDALLDGGGNVNMPYPRRSPLEIAIKENKVDIVEELMMAGAELPRGEIKATHEMKRLIKRLTRTIASNPSR
jgi:ankyrin repeat protein